MPITCLMLLHVMGHKRFNALFDLDYTLRWGRGGAIEGQTGGIVTAGGPRVGDAGSLQRSPWSERAQ